MNTRIFPFQFFLAAFILAGLFASCRTTPAPVQEQLTALDEYVWAEDTAFQYSVVDTLEGEGYTAYVVRMVSQRWLTEAEVKDPLWWHWMNIVVPDQIRGKTGLLFIGGGSHNTAQPSAGWDMGVQAALATQTPVAYLHNIPNQPLEFVSDSFGPRVEDELIAYGWRQFLEGGGKVEDAKWLARLPMTKAAVRALDVLADLPATRLDSFVVAGGSKRGWTTWTTAAVDKRVKGIVPIVIDMLNVIPSFEHHWQVYGFWAPAVGNYEEEGIMEWQGTPEYQALVDLTEPYSYRHRLNLPKLLIHATGDQFFIPDSWQFYWDSLPGEKYLRYVPNADHSLRESDAFQSLVAYYHSLVKPESRPKFEWRKEGNTLVIQTDPAYPPQAIKLWRAHNATARDFRVETIGKTWESQEVVQSSDRQYRLTIPEPDSGFAAFFGELTFKGPGDLPLKFTTGVVVTPDSLPYPPFVGKMNQ